MKIRLERVATDLRIWSKATFGKVRLQLQIANEVILQLDMVQEHRTLSDAELNLRRSLKHKVLGLVAIERARKLRASRVSWLRAGDASTRFFHAKMQARRRKNHIHAFNSNNIMVVDHRK